VPARRFDEPFQEIPISGLEYYLFGHRVSIFDHEGFLLGDDIEAKEEEEEGKMRGIYEKTYRHIEGAPIPP
jgi:hypothetical protein